MKNYIQLMLVFQFGDRRLGRTESLFYTAKELTDGDSERHRQFFIEDTSFFDIPAGEIKHHLPEEIAYWLETKEYRFDSNTNRLYMNDGDLLELRLLFG